MMTRIQGVGTGTSGRSGSDRANTTFAENLPRYFGHQWNSLVELSSVSKQTLFAILTAGFEELSTKPSIVRYQDLSKYLTMQESSNFLSLARTTSLDVVGPQLAYRFHGKSEHRSF